MRQFHCISNKLHTPIYLPYCRTCDAEHFNGLLIQMHALFCNLVCSNDRMSMTIFEYDDTTKQRPIDRRIDRDPSRARVMLSKNEKSCKVM